MPDNVTVEKLYWLDKSGMDAMRVTWMVPEPVIVPAVAPLFITTALPGVNTPLAPVTVKVPLTLKLAFAETLALFAMVRLLNGVVELPAMVAGLPEKIT